MPYCGVPLYVYAVWPYQNSLIRKSIYRERGIEKREPGQTRRDNQDGTIKSSRDGDVVVLSDVYGL